MPDGIRLHLSSYFFLDYIYRIEIRQGLETTLHLTKEEDEAGNRQKQKEQE